MRRTILQLWKQCVLLMELYGVSLLPYLLILKLRASISIGEQVALVGEEDDVIYAILDTTSIYKVDQQMKQLKFSKQMTWLTQV